MINLKELNKEYLHADFMYKIDLKDSKDNIEFFIDFGVSRSISRFTEYETKSPTRENGKYKNSNQIASRENTSNSKRTKQINRVAIAHNRSSSSNTSVVKSLTTPANSLNDF